MTTSSNTDTICNVRIYTTSSNTEKPNHRLSVIRWKQTTDKPKVPSARCVSVPKLVLTVAPAILAEAIQSAYEDMQDSLVRSIVEAQLEKDPNTNTFTFSEDLVNEAAVAAFQAEKNGPGRLSTERLNNWFDTSLSEALYVAIANKLGLGDEPSKADTAKVTKAVDQHKKLIAGLSAPKAHLPANIAEQLEKAVSLASDDDTKIKSVLLAKLVKFTKPEEISLLESL